MEPCIKECQCCGRKFTKLTWKTLQELGPLFDLAEMRKCLCGSTLTVKYQDLRTSG